MRAPTLYIDLFYFTNLPFFSTFGAAGHFSMVIHLPAHLTVGAQQPHIFTTPLAWPLHKTLSLQGAGWQVGVE
jgi:uncharacterized membrane protein YdfJ with MMPL/SSD domain